MPSEPAFVELHAEMLRLLKSFHAVCVEHNIKYSLHGGTLLGAVREKGFIPWDDDMDISMSRSEYKKLCYAIELMGESCEIKLEQFERIVRVIPKVGSNTVIWIDILIYDCISDNKFAQKCKIYGLMLFGAILKTKHGFEMTKQKIGTKYSKSQYVLYYCAYLLGLLVPLKWKQKWFHCFAEKCFCGKRTLVHRGNDQYSALYLILPANILDAYELLPFEDTEVMVSKKYHDILVASYGKDYMTPVRPEEFEVKVHEMARNI